MAAPAWGRTSITSFGGWRVSINTIELWSGERDSNPRSRALKAPQNASPVTTAYGCSGGSRTLFILDYETNELSEALPSYK